MINKQFKILSRHDVKSIAKSINKNLTLPEIDKVLDDYQIAQDDDPTATWDLVIENLIYNVINDRNPLLNK